MRTNFAISVDGVHCRFHELEDEERAKNPTNYSHKFSGPGLAYELALSIYENKLVWMRGPFKPSKSDLAIYQNELKGMLPVDKRAACDGGYRDKNDPRLATPDSLDPPEHLSFKSRCRMRQENFNSRIKRFSCLQLDFRHSMERHGDCFKAICVTCVFKMELVSPMFYV